MRRGAVGAGQASHLLVVASIVFVFAMVASLFTSAAQRESAAGGAPPVTFSRDIAPLVFEHCGVCHHPDGPAPFSLLTYDEVRRRATQIAAVTATRYMPPWKAEPGYGEFVGHDPLTDAEIALLQRWAREGAPAGDPRDLPTRPEWTAGWQLGEPDMIVEMPEPYLLPASGDDVFRTFVIRLPVDRLRYVRGLEFRPVNPQVVHHANIRIDRTPASRELDRQDPLPGFSGMALSALFPDGHFLAWAPGQVSPLLPEGLAWNLESGTDLVFQLHLRPTGKPETVQVAVGLFFGTAPPQRRPLILRLGRQDIDIPPGAPSHPLTDSYVLPVDVEVLSLQPHAHYLADEIRVFAQLPDGAIRWLVFIREWDFRWQHVYRLRERMALPRGTTLRMEFTYDNSAGNPRNPSNPPTRVGYGWRSADEMGEVYIQVFTASERDRAVLDQSFQQKSIAEDIAGYKNIIARGLGNVALLHHDAAVLYMQLGRRDEAVTHYQASLDLQPGSAVAHFNLGTALMLAGRLAESVAQLQAAARIRPGYAVAHNNLAQALAGLGRSDEALFHYREALRAAPQHAPAHNNLGLMLMQVGQLEEAVPRFLEALRLEPALLDAHYNVGHALQRLGRPAEAVTHFREALRLNPDDAASLRSAAWLLATTPDDGVRDAEASVLLAERAVTVTERRDAAALDALGAAYAAAGLFDRAARATDEAMALGPQEPLAAALLERRALYARGLPYREPPPSIR